MFVWLIRFFGGCEAKARGEQDHDVSSTTGDLTKNLSDDEEVGEKNKRESGMKMKVFEEAENSCMSARAIFGQERPLLLRYTKVM